MRRKYRQLRSLLRGHEQPLVEYTAQTLAFFIIGVVVVRTYMDYTILDERAARGVTSLTMGALIFAGALIIWRSRKISLARSLGKFSLQKAAMAVIPHVLYLVVVGSTGFYYLYVYFAIAITWGMFVAFPANYWLFDKWSLKGIEKA